MGTNYYAIPLATYEVKQQIKMAVDDNDFNTAKNLLPERVHIGKSSGGWQFLFNLNEEKYYKDHRESIEGFLNRCQIVDEYNDPVSSLEFWHLVEAKKHLKAETEHGYINLTDKLYFSRYADFS
jgi:hypothetical protein